MTQSFSGDQYRSKSAFDDPGFPFANNYAGFAENIQKSTNRRNTASNKNDEVSSRASSVSSGSFISARDGLPENVDEYAALEQKLRIKNQKKGQQKFKKHCISISTYILAWLNID